EPLFGAIFLTNRGVLLPRMVLEPGGLVVIALAAGAVLLSVALAIWARRRRERTGVRFPWRRYALLAIVALPTAGYFMAGRPIALELPELQGFNFVGGARVNPEFLALLFALSTYTASFIAEI